MAVNWLKNRLITNNESLDPVLFFRSVMWTIRKEIVVSKNMPHRFVAYALFTCAYFDVTSDNNFSRKQKESP